MIFSNTVFFDFSSTSPFSTDLEKIPTFAIHNNLRIFVLLNKL